MAKRLTRYILIALVLGVVAGWSINAAIDDGSPQAAARLKEIADYLSIVTTLFLRLIKMIIAPLVFSTLVAGIAHMGNIAALGRVAVTGVVRPRQPGFADARPDPGDAASARRWTEPTAAAGHRCERGRDCRV
jgi:xanthine/uracil permease